MNHIMAVCDEEENYAIKLVDYLNMKEGFPFEVRNFNNIEKMKEFNDKQRLDVALISKNNYEKALMFIPIEQLIVLSETGTELLDSRKSIYKYQSCDDVIREILKIIAQNHDTNRIISRKSSFKIIGFYSPVKRSFQTTSALTMGQFLSKKSRTLYLNLEGFSGLSSYLKINSNRDISELLYYLQSGKTGIQYLLGSMVVKLHGLDILPPMMYQMDLINICQKNWINLLNELEKYSDYEYVLLDLSDSIQGLFEILRQCTNIYTSIQDDTFANMKIEQYENMLITCNYDDILDKTRKIVIPQIINFSSTFDKLTFCGTSDFIKNVVQEDFYD